MKRFVSLRIGEKFRFPVNGAAGVTHHQKTDLCLKVSNEWRRDLTLEITNPTYGREDRRQIGGHTVWTTSLLREVIPVSRKRYRRHRRQHVTMEQP